MQSTARILLVFAVFSVVAVVMAPALYADDDHVPSNPTTMGGMMGRGRMDGMMGRMRVTDHCGAMMRSDDRPNDQWRAPRSPDADGNSSRR